MGSAAPTGDDGSVIVLPLLAGVIVGTMDEWFQWFIPIRAGEARDIILDIVATACGLLFALSVEPPRWLGLSLRRRSIRRVAVGAGVAVAVFAFFILSVHVGYDVRDPRIGTFRARYSAAELRNCRATVPSGGPLSLRWCCDDCHVRTSTSAKACGTSSGGTPRGTLVSWPRPGART